MHVQGQVDLTNTERVCVFSKRRMATRLDILSSLGLQWQNDSMAPSLRSPLLATQDTKQTNHGQSTPRLLSRAFLSRNVVADSASTECMFFVLSSQHGLLTERTPSSSRRVAHNASDQLDTRRVTHESLGLAQGVFCGLWSVIGACGVWSGWRVCIVKKIVTLNTDGMSLSSLQSRWSKLLLFLQEYKAPTFSESS